MRPSMFVLDRRAPPAWLAVLPYFVLLAGAFHVFAMGSVGPFVTFRYARNLLAGLGPVYNAGERVEGFTSPLHLALVTALLAVGRGVGLFFKVKLLGIAAAALGLWQVRRLARLADLSALEAVLAQLLTAVSVNYACAATNGSETSLYICTLLGAAIAYVNEREGRRGCWSAVLLFLVLLTRPDGAVVFAFFFLLRANDVRTGRLTFRQGAEWAATYGALVAAFIAARFSYYGVLLPNTYLAKSIRPDKVLPAGFKYMLTALAPPGSGEVWRVASGAAFWGLAGLGLWRNRGRRNAAVLAFGAASSVVFVLKSGVVAGLGWRYLEPAAPFLAILQVWGLGELAGDRSRESRPTPLFAGLALAALLLFAATFPQVRGHSWETARFTTRDADFLVAGERSVGEQWLQAAELVQATVPPGALIAGWDTGYLAYRNPEDRFLDLRGLTDREIASLPSSYKSNIGVVDDRWFLPGDPLNAIWMRRRPEYVVVYGHRDLVLPGYSVWRSVDAVASNGAEVTIRIHARLRESAP